MWRRDYRVRRLLLCCDKKCELLRKSGSLDIVIRNSWGKFLPVILLCDFNKPFYCQREMTLPDDTLEYVINLNNTHQCLFRISLSQVIKGHHHHLTEEPFILYLSSQLGGLLCRGNLFISIFCGTSWSSYAVEMLAGDNGALLKWELFSYYFRQLSYGNIS